MEVGDYERGLQYLGVAKRVTALARKLDDDEAEQLRRSADRLVERGLTLVMGGVRSLARELAEAKAAVAER